MTAPEGPTVPVRGRLLARNALLNLVGNGVPLLVALIAIPSVVARLGTARFGLLTLAWALLGYFGFMDLGLGRATTRFVAEALGRGARDEIPRIVRSTIYVQLPLGGAGTLLLAAASPLLAKSFLRIPSELTTEAQWTFVALSVAVPSLVITASLRGLLEAAQRFDLVNLLRVPFSTSNFLVPLIGALAGWSLPTIVGVLVLMRYLSLFAHYRACVRAFPNLRDRTAFDSITIRRLIHFGGWVSVSSVLSPILVYVDRFVIGAILGITAVAHYAAPYEIITRLWIVPASIVATLFPAFSSLFGRGEATRLRSLMGRSTRIILSLLVPAALVILIFADEILEVWLGPEFARHGANVFRILAIGVVINSAAHPAYDFLQAVGRPDLTAKFHLLELPIHGCLLWYLTSRFGITGAALAWSARVTLDALLLFGAVPRARARLHTTDVPWRTQAAVDSAP